eukprot:scaffold63289_cov79-Phaeocystis_antarctica.AAC.1
MAPHARRQFYYASERLPCVETISFACADHWSAQTCQLTCDLVSTVLRHAPLLELQKRMVPGRTKAVGSKALEVGTRGSSWAIRGPVSPPRSAKSPRADRVALLRVGDAI